MDDSPVHYVIYWGRALLYYLVADLYMPAGQGAQSAPGPGILNSVRDT